jgi:hypothetical protein
MTVVGERRLAMTLENETFELGLIAKAFQAISKEISYRGLAKALLQAALGYSGAVRGAVLLSEGDELLAKADASFPRERAKIFASHPPRRRIPIASRPQRKGAYAPRDHRQKR